MDTLEKKRLHAKLRCYANRGVFHNKRILLFGGTRYLRGMWEYLTEEGISIAGIIDKDSRKSGSDYMGIPICLPEELLQPYDDRTVVLILSNRYYREMTAQLTNMGYRKNRHFFILNDVVGTKNDESLHSLLRMLVRNCMGLSAYRKLTGRSRKHVFVVPYNGSGNVYLIGLFFQEYLKRHEIKDYAFVVVSDMCRRVAELFEIQNIVVMDAGLVEDMIRCGGFLRGRMKLTVLHDGWKSDVTRWLKGYKGLDFEHYFRYLVFDFDDTVMHCLPPRWDRSAEVAEMFEKYHLQPGRTVVLSPYANTLYEKREALWKSIAEQFQNQGYSVCTNCASEEEKPVEGTVPIFFPFSLAVDFLDAAGYFVGLRSGLCDIISSSRCKKIILYENAAAAYASSVYEYFNLKNMGLCEDALEMEVGSDAALKLLKF